DADGGEHVAGRKRGLEQALEEIVGFDRELPLRPDHFDFAVERDDACRQFGGRIGEGERAADGAAVAGRGGAGMRQRQGDGRGCGGARGGGGGAGGWRGGVSVGAWRPSARLSGWAFFAAPGWSPPMPLMSTSSAGSLSRMLSVAIRLCPPASSRASSFASNS